MVRALLEAQSLCSPGHPQPIPALLPKGKGSQKHRPNPTQRGNRVGALPPHMVSGKRKGETGPSVKDM